MRGTNIRLIKETCTNFNWNDLQKQYKRNGDLTYNFSYTKKGTSFISDDFESDHGLFDFNSSTGILSYDTANGFDPDTGKLDLYTLIKIYVDNDGYLVALVPYNIEEEISFELDEADGTFKINENT